MPTYRRAGAVHHTMAAPHALTTDTGGGVHARLMLGFKLVGSER